VLVCPMNLARHGGKGGWHGSRCLCGGACACVHTEPGKPWREGGPAKAGRGESTGLFAAPAQRRRSNMLCVLLCRHLCCPQHQAGCWQAVPATPAQSYSLLTYLQNNMEYLCGSQLPSDIHHTALAEAFTTPAILAYSNLSCVIPSCPPPIASDYHTGCWQAVPPAQPHLSQPPSRQY
jgi:hypothetical protein